MATIKEVADRAHVSVATVSRVINKTGYVSPDLEQRVVEAMLKLNYQPSALAQSLRSQRTAVVGVLIPQLDQPFFSALTFAIEQSLFASDYRSLICSAEENREKENAYIDMLIRQRVDGVILVPTGYSTDNVYRLLEQKVPVVIVDRDLPDVRGVNRVLIDNYQGGYDGMYFLLEMGHRRVGIIGTSEHSEAMALRIRGVQQAMSDYNASFEPDLFITGTTAQFELGYTAARTLLEQSSRPSAIFALTDVIAVGVLHAAAMLGLRVPHDLSVIGYDNIPLSSYIIPALTTVGQPIYRIGEVAAALLLRQMRQENAPLETIMMNTELVIRNSTLAHQA